MSADGHRIKVFQSKTKVIHIMTLHPRRGTTQPAQLAVYRHQIDQGTAGAQLHQPDIIQSPLYGTAQ